MNSSDDIVVALLLAIGLFFPTSVGDQSQEYLVIIALTALLGLLLFLMLKHGTRPGAVAAISLPILLVLTAGTLLACNFRVGGTFVAEYCLLAAVLALDLRHVRTARKVSIVFVAANVLWIACGTAILIGSAPVSEFLTSWYSQFYPELVPGMLALHKPVLTFGTHSLAGFFTYLFFWLNWEGYKSRGSATSLAFALCEAILLIANTSFTSFAFAALAVGQISFWFWSRNRKLLLVSVVCLILLLAMAGSILAEQIEALWQIPEVATSVLNADNSGLLVRYSDGGTVRGTIDYIWDHPYTPIGFTFPSFLFLGDSGPVEYLLRGSIPLLLLVYFGLYRFLRFNSIRREHALWLFFVVLAFESGFNALTYFRTLFLLPFLAIYLNEITSAQNTGHVSQS
jgi:hypothetical protein